MSATGINIMVASIWIFIQNNQQTNKKNLPCQHSACVPSLFYTSFSARTCLTRSGRITVGCARLSPCVSYKHTFVCTSVSVVSLHLRCDWRRAVRARSGQVVTFMCLHTKTWTHLTRAVTCGPVQGGYCEKVGKNLHGNPNLSYLIRTNSRDQGSEVIVINNDFTMNRSQQTDGDYSRDKFPQKAWSSAPLCSQPRERQHTQRLPMLLY